jgi:hypothetical protein
MPLPGDLLEQAQFLVQRELRRPRQASLRRAVSAVARNFVRLQDKRHIADYDMAIRFDRYRVQYAVALATQLFADWNTIRSSDEARVFLASLMFWKRWSK